MELKVLCGCGQKYKFDVEPVNGQMPFAVNCPSCGVDGTPVANQQLAEHFINNPPPPAPAPAPPAPGGLRINRPTPPPPSVPIPPSVAAPPVLAANRAPAPVAGPRAAIKPLMKTPIDAPKDFNMGLGILGAFLGSAVGGGFTYGFFILTGFRFWLTGTAIGLLAGIGARWLASGTDSTLGIIAAVIAVITIVGVFFLMYGGFPVLLILSVVVCGYLAYRVAAG